MKSRPSKIKYERFKKHGLDDFQGHDVVELLLSLILPQKNAESLSRSLSVKFDGFRGVLDAPIGQLKSVEGVDDKSTVLIKLVKEAACFYLKERIISKNIIKNRQDIINYLNMSLSSERNEKFAAIFLNSKNEIIDIETIHEGTTDQIVVYPRRVIESALKFNASSIIFVHNHPSGDVSPSYADFLLAKRLSSATSAVDIVIHDHIIIGKNTYFSGKDNGWLDNRSSHYTTINNNAYSYLSE
jgi:DNA repair protein RadC